ncbi:MAG: AAA family ATPase, partial [Polaromonas sp.]|nr:AAA family ATPase [Polaromonas sp.]
MTILIPSIGSCTSRMSSSERRLAERLEQKLGDDYLLWYDVPVGPRRSHPNFMVMHPRRGLLILEVRDWSAKNIHRASEQNWQLFSDRMLSTRPNPAGVARQYAQEVFEALMRDPQLVEPGSRAQPDKLRFPWSWGVAFPNLTREEFLRGKLGSFIEPQRVLCSDEMLESVEPKALQSQLWDMFPLMMGGLMTPAMLERVRWSLFPGLRLQRGALFDDDDASAKLPEPLRVLDLPQERLMRSLGDGHRVIHGVAGSGKTLLLTQRADHLARAHTPDPRPILILCYNEPLAVMLAGQMQAKGLGNRVRALHFHKWCRDQLVAFGQELPAPNMPVGAKMEEMVQRVIRAVEAEQIPSGQYQAILIDEGHDFAPEWLKLITRMVDPATNSLLLMYDDAQSIYERSRSKQFSFKSVGIQAQGRTAILKVNHRNTRQILHTASLIAADLLTADAQ